jgi:hypothetical protein
MSTNKDLFKEAIADAKQVREAALANAKAALEEALTPKLHSMLAAKLEEMNDSDEDEKLEEVDYISANDKSKNTDYVRSQYIKTGAMSESEEELEEDFDLSAILAELGDEEQVSNDAVIDAAETIDEAYDKEEMDEAADEETEETEETEDEESEEETEIEGDKITDLTVDQLKDIIKDIISAELEAEEYETPGEEEAEMGGEEMSMDMGDMGGEEEEVNLEELLAELDALDEVEEEDEAMYEAKKKKEKEEKDEKDEMKEAIDTINALRNELNETNLLNAKLLYVNKIFKAKNLTESQKLKVIASFDKATTPKQAKELFESIQSSDFGASKKSQIKESLGFASKAAGVAPKNSANTIVESNDVIARMQKLANIIK